MILLFEFMFRVSICLLLLRAGLTKVFRPHTLTIPLRALRIPVSGIIHWTRTIACLELALAGFALLAPRSLVGVAIAAAFVAFTVVALLLRRAAVDCGCGAGAIFGTTGSLSRVMAPRLFVVVAALGVMWLPATEPGDVHGGALTLAAAFVLVGLVAVSVSGLSPSRPGLPVASDERVLAFPRIAVGKVGLLESGETPRALGESREAQGTIRVPLARVALDVTPGVDPAYATAGLKPDDLHSLRVDYLPRQDCAFLHRLGGLHRLVLATNVEDACIQAVGGVQALRQLVLVGGNISHQGLRELRSLSLSELLLSSPGLTDSGLLELVAHMPTLSHLTIDAWDGVTDRFAEGLVQSVTGLRTVAFRFCPFVTPVAVEVLEASGVVSGVHTEVFLNKRGLLRQEMPWAEPFVFDRRGRRLRWSPLDSVAETHT